MLKFHEYAYKCIRQLNKNGFEGYLVGGCVRDALLNRVSDDIDITTNAKPEDVIRIFEHTIPTGIKHGTITVIIDEHPIEVTTYRVESNYSDARHPDKVTFVNELSADLSRRDFTINALAYNNEASLVDLHSGVEDLNNKVIRTVGNPELRFKEDALRILRAIRFACVLDFRIEANTLSATFSNSELLCTVSGERILQELYKLSLAKDFGSFIDFVNFGALSSFGIYPSNISNSAFKRLTEFKSDKENKLSLLISLIKHDTETIIRTLKPSKKLSDNLIFLDFAQNSEILTDKISLKHFLSKYGEDKTLLYLNYLSLFDPIKYKILVEYITEIKENNEPYRISDLALNGDDIRNVGFIGTDVGKVLKALLTYVITDERKNNKKDLLNFIKNNITKL